MDLLGFLVTESLNALSQAALLLFLGRADPDLRHHPHRQFHAWHVLYARRVYRIFDGAAQRRLFGWRWCWRRSRSELQVTVGRPFICGKASRIMRTAEILHRRRVGRAADKSCERPHVPNVVVTHLLGKTTHPHVLDHARPQRADWLVRRMEVIGSSSLKPKVAGPSMLGIGCPDRHALLFTRSPSLPENGSAPRSYGWFCLANSLLRATVGAAAARASRSKLSASSNTAFLAAGSASWPATSRACSARSSQSKASFKSDGIRSSHSVRKSSFLSARETVSPVPSIARPRSWKRLPENGLGTRQYCGDPKAFGRHCVICSLTPEHGAKRLSKCQPCCKA